MAFHPLSILLNRLFTIADGIKLICSHWINKFAIAQNLNHSNTVTTNDQKPTEELSEAESLEIWAPELLSFLGGQQVSVSILFGRNKNEYLRRKQRKKLSGT